MSIKIEEGGYFVTRAGDVAGPMRFRDGFAQPWYDPHHQRRYSENGSWFLSGVSSANDLIGRCVDKPKQDVKSALADEAKAIVTGARRSAYGSPENNFERIARFWQAYFENTGRGDVKLTAADISPLMRLMKEARLCETPDHRDSFVDLIGYTLTGAEINKVDPQKPA